MRNLRYNSIETRPDLTDFDESRVAARTPQVDLNGAQPLSDFRDEIQSSGSGVVNDKTSEFEIVHTSAGDFARITSSIRGIYQPGSSLEAGVGIRLDTESLSGDGKAVWGYFDMEESGGSNTENINDGIVFGLDKDGFFVEVIKAASSKKKIRDGNFNRVQTINPTLKDGTIWQIEFTYYGYGLIRFQRVVGYSGDGKQSIETFHTERLTGETSLNNPNLQVGALAKSSSGTGAFKVFVGGRHISVIGQPAVKKRVNYGRVEAKSIGTSFEPVMSFRKKSSFRSVGVNLFGASLIPDGDVCIQVRVDSDITGGTSPSFGSLNEQGDSETALELDTTADSVDTGTGVKVFEEVLAGGTSSNATAPQPVRDVPVEVPDEGLINIIAKSLTGSSISLDASVGVTERW